MKNLSNAKIEKSKEFKLNSIEDCIKLNYPTEFDQMILNDDIDRKKICFVRYQAKTLKRTVKKITFPLYSTIEKDFKNNYCGGEGNHGNIKRNPSDFIDNILNQEGVKIETFDKLNNNKLAYYEIPIEIKEGVILNKQPLYFIPSLTKYYSCKECNGAQYVTCSDPVCQGRHEWTCTKCNGNGKVTCKKCSGKGESTCDECNGKGEYRCTICKGVGTVKCPTCRGTGRETYYDNINSTKSREKRCTNCGGKGEIRCSTHAKSTSLIGKGLRMATSDSCKGAGTIQCKECNTTGKITCEKCNGSGEVTCKECNGNGTIVCNICYGDKERYGKVDCATCSTMGEIGEIVIVETKIELHDTELLFEFGKVLPTANFPKEKQLEMIKNYVSSNYKTQETYYKIIEKAGDEISRENSDEYSKEIILKTRHDLNIKIDDYSKLLEEHIYYEVVPSLTLSYKHILTNTEHKLSFIAIDTNDPAIVFHSKPDDVTLTKQSFSEVFGQVLSKAFSTKKFKEKIDKRNTIVLLIHIAKADQIIEHAEKVFLSKLIKDLDNFNTGEKKLLFNLMASSELPELKKKYARFSNIEKEDEVKKHLLDLSKLDGELEGSEEKKLNELNSFIDNSRQNKFVKGIMNFLSAWQISIPSIIFIILPLITYLLAIMVALILMIFGPNKSEDVSNKPVISNVEESKVNIDNKNQKDIKGEDLQEEQVVKDVIENGQPNDTSSKFSQTESGLVTESNFTLTATIIGATDDVAYLQQRKDGEWIKVDSADLVADLVVFKGNVELPEFFYVTLKGTKGYIPVFLEQGEITVKSNINNIHDATVEGSETHKAYDDFMKSLATFDEEIAALGQQYQKVKTDGDEESMNIVEVEYEAMEKMKSQSILDYAKTNNESVASAFIIMSNSYMFELDELDEVTSGFSDNISTSYYVEYLKDRVSTLKSVAVGQKYVDFTLNDPEGNPIPLSSVIDGKYVLVDFWASWSGPCRAENPNVVEVYKTYHEKGFDVFGVSFDKDHDKWVEAIKEDSLTWTHVSDLQGWNSVAAKLYAIRSIPQNILIDPDGIIIEKNLRGKELQIKLADLLGPFEN